MKIRKGDRVKIQSGKDRGKTGTVEKIFPKVDKIIVSGVNLYKRHLPKTKDGGGGIIERPRAFFVGKVSLICPKCQKETRVGFQLVEKEKIRICKKCHEEV